MGSSRQAWDELLRSVSFFKQRWHCLTVRPQPLLAVWRTRREDTEHPLTELQAEQRRALQEQHRQAVKQARKDKTARFLHEVDQAIDRGDQHVAYQTLKLLKPWKPALKAQLKDENGFLLSPATELKELGQYATKVFAAHPRLPDQAGLMPQLDPARLARHIASIKPGKAVPKGSAPAAAWKLCVQPISQALSHYCASLNTQQPPGDGLTRADLCLIPKPGKPADKPRLESYALTLRDWQVPPRNSWNRSLCPTCGLCLSLLTSQDAAFLMHRVGSYSI